MSNDLPEADFWPGIIWDCLSSERNLVPATAPNRRKLPSQNCWTMDTASLGTAAEMPIRKGAAFPPVLKITRGVLIRLENFLL
jgi:hypothetical protein